jgi:hexosaminidase
MPVQVEFSVSADGEHFTKVASMKNRLDERYEGTMIRDFTAKTGKREARYIRIRAVNRGVCPSWHAGAGDKAWIFVDEIGVR